MNEDFTVTNANGVKYKFRVCSALTDNTCGTNIGMLYFMKDPCIMII